MAALALGAALLAQPLGACAQPFADIAAPDEKYTAIVLDAVTGETLYAKRADSPRYPASVTKVMTFYLTFEALASGRLRLSDQILVSPLAASQPPTKLGLRAGETISVEDAMHAMAVHSANDMAVALAERIGGTESRFAAMMTQKAQQLGMVNTRYVNANGLPDSRQISTARDIAILTRAILRDYPQYYGFFGQEEFTYRGKTMYNTNHLLGRMPGVDGLKTGFTNAAGYNLDASAMRNGKRLIAVVMGTSSGQVRNANVEGLLLTGFDIMDRRARGERIGNPQMLFEASIPSYAGAARVDNQGEGDSDPIGLVLTQTATRPGGERAATHRNWWVQVGAFRTQMEARLQVETIAHRFADIFENTEGSVAGYGSGYLARFSGFTQTAAQEACSEVRSQGLSCAVGGPA